MALLPVLFIVGGQLYFQSRFVIPNAMSSPDFESFAGSVGDLNSFIWNLRISRFLIWQPGGWLGRATGAASVGRYDLWAAWTALLALFVVLGYFAHRTMVSKLYFGELVRVQAKGQSSNKALKAGGPKLPFVAVRVVTGVVGVPGCRLARFQTQPLHHSHGHRPGNSGDHGDFFQQHHAGTGLRHCRAAGLHCRDDGNAQLRAQRLRYPG